MIWSVLTSGTFVFVKDAHVCHVCLHMHTRFRDHPRDQQQQRFRGGARSLFFLCVCMLLLPFTKLNLCLFFLVMKNHTYFSRVILGTGREPRCSKEPVLASGDCSGFCAPTGRLGTRSGLWSCAARTRHHFLPSPQHPGGRVALERP